MNKLLLKGVAAAFCMATMFGTTACGDDDDLVNVWKLPTHCMLTYHFCPLSNPVKPKFLFVQNSICL